MYRFPPIPHALAAALLAAATACMTTTSTGAPSKTSGTNADAAAATNPKANANATAPASLSPPTPTASESPVTLPALDALFSDSTFAGALRAKLQLTNEQIEGLRKIAREGTAKLSESEAGS